MPSPLYLTGVDEPCVAETGQTSEPCFAESGPTSEPLVAESGPTSEPIVAETGYVSEPRVAETGYVSEPRVAEAGTEHGDHEDLCFAQTEKGSEPGVREDDEDDALPDVEVDTEEVVAEVATEAPNDNQESDRDDEDELEEESGYEASADEVEVDGDGVDASLRGGKGKQVVSDNELEEDEGSDYEDEDNMRIHQNSSSESGTELEDEFAPSSSRKCKKRKNVLPDFPAFREDTDMGQDCFKLGLVFPNAKVFKDAVREYAIRAGKQIYFKKNDPERVRACCRDPNCNWVCYASVIGHTDSFLIKTYRSEHTCPRTNNNRYMYLSILRKVMGSTIMYVFIYVFIYVF